MPPTKYQLAVIGDPIEHSLSPPMQNAALKELKLPYQYKKIWVQQGKLKSFLKNEAKTLRGFNLTLPHKEDILPLLDWISAPAKTIGAVNTVVRHQQSWLGFNTDGAGYLSSLELEQKYSIKKKQILFLGAGGAARSIAVAMILGGADAITFANRNLDRAKKLIADLKRYYPKAKLTAISLLGKKFEAHITQTQLLINTTSIGLNGTNFDDFPWAVVSKDTLISDIVYTPRFTPFLMDAKKTGLAIHTGEGMLAHQGALALQLWTGKYPNVHLMHQVLLKRLSK